MTKHVYLFGGGKADGNEKMKNLLGGKGANLAEMAGHRALRPRKAMPGMMETVLKGGLNERTAEGIIKATGNPRFVYDAYRRLIQMYSDVGMEKAEGLEAAEGMGIRQQLERELDRMKKARGVKQDTELTAGDLKELIRVYKAKVREVLGKDFPDDTL